MSRKGIYFLANDYYLDHTIAFLNSTRLHNPNLPLCFIPFDGRIDRTIELQRTYGFEFYPDDGILRRCDAISLMFHQEVNGDYRKLAIWDGPFESFVCFDVDTVLTDTISFIFDVLGDYKYVVACGGHTGMVWDDSIRETGVLTDEQVAFSANAGMIASSRGVTNIRDIEKKLPQALRLRSHMALFCWAQPLLNYLMVISESFATLECLARATRDSKIMTQFWAGWSEGAEQFQVKQGRFVRWPSSFPYPIFSVHWAGLAKACSNENGETVIDPDMPLKELWEYYRYLRPDPLSR